MKFNVALAAKGHAIGGYKAEFWVSVPVSNMVSYQVFASRAFAAYSALPIIETVNLELPNSYSPLVSAMD